MPWCLRSCACAAFFNPRAHARDVGATIRQCSPLQHHYTADRTNVNGYRKSGPFSIKRMAQIWLMNVRVRYHKLPVFVGAVGFTCSGLCTEPSTYEEQPQPRNGNWVLWKWPRMGCYNLSDFAVMLVSLNSPSFEGVL